MSNPSLVSANVRITVGGRTFSINADGDSVNYRDLTESRTGKFVTEKQKVMLGRVVAPLTGAVAKLSLPTETAPRAAKVVVKAKAAKPAAKAKAKG